jgi:hypothetical protein
LDYLHESAAMDNSYISSWYDEHDPKLSVLQQLGVKIMDFPRFLELLAKRFVYDFAGYKQMDSLWHATLAQVLAKVSGAEWDASAEEM